MDIVLEVFDTYMLDRFYATLFPLSPAEQRLSSLKTLNEQLSNANATWSSYAGRETLSGYTYEPASKYFAVGVTPYAYESRLPRDSAFRQMTSLYLLTWLFGMVIYFAMATASYVFIFDKETFNHPKFLKNQISLEIKQTMIALPIMAIFTVPFFLAEVRGYSRMYDTMPADSLWNLGGWYSYLQFPLFLVFTDFFIYWIHRGLHHPKIYKHLHKPHHKWIMPSPFASHAFHPLDGFAQSVPYHVFPFLFPLNKFAYIALFVFINVWTVMIHDGEYVANSPIINGAACHTLHHLYFTCNYGQYTTLWDRMGGSYRLPNNELFHKETKMAKDEWKRQVQEMEVVQRAVEGDDDERVYETEETRTGYEEKKLQ